MRLTFVLLLGLVVGCASPTAADGATAPGVVVGELLCLSGAFSANASRDSFIAAYGAENVTSESLEDEGGEYVSTTVFGGDRRLNLRWKNDSTLSEPASISVAGDTSAWTGPHGLSLGMTLEDLERLNGGPFEILGFGWDYGGQIWDMRGGEINRDVAGGCRLFVFFGTTEEPTGDLIGDRAIMSSDPALRAMQPTVRLITYRYP